jgi:hypothetical protein
MNDNRICPLLRRVCYGENCAWFNPSRFDNNCAIAAIPDVITESSINREQCSRKIDKNLIDINDQLFKLNSLMERSATT